MAGTTPLTQADLRAAFVTAYAAAAKKIANTNAGSTMGAIASATAQVGETLDGRVEDLAAITRSSTSTGANLDSLWLPFGITRIGAVASTGVVTLGIRSPAAQPISYAPGLIVQTTSPVNGQNVQFLVVTSSLPGYVGNAYTIPPGSTTVDAAVVCLTPGTVGNVDAGAIGSVYQAAGLSSANTPQTVTNALAFTNGRDQESDVDFRARASATVASGITGTTPAILAAVAGVRTGLTYQFGDAINADGTPHSAHFTLIVDVLGSAGGPSQQLLDEVACAVDGGTYNGKTYIQTRAAGTTRDIIGPTEVPINVTAVLHLAQGAVAADTIAAAQNALGAYLNSFPLQIDNSPTIVPYAEIVAQLLQVPGVTYPSNTTISAGAGSAGYVDLSVAFAHRAVAGMLTFTTA